MVEDVKRELKREDWYASERMTDQPDLRVVRLNARIHSQREQLSHSQFVIGRLKARIVELDAECERAWEAYRIAHDQAMANGERITPEIDRALRQAHRDGAELLGLIPPANALKLTVVKTMGENG